MPGAVQGKKADKDKSMIKEPFAMEVEAETDRRILCERIITSLDLANGKNAMMGVTSASAFGGFGSGPPDRSAIVVQEGRVATEGTTERGGNTKNPSMQATGMKGAPKRGGATTTQPRSIAAADDKSVRGDASNGANIENISIATYVCDFGNVVVGSTKRRPFLMTNVGKLQVAYGFDKRAMQEAGIEIITDKVARLGLNSSEHFEVKYTTRKSAKYGPTKHIIPIDVKGGPSYAIKVTANLTIPELSMSEEQVDFGKVCVGTRKTIKLRFENKKEVPCEWWYYFKHDVSA